MQEDLHLRVRLRFGVFELDLRAGELRKHGLRVRLQEQPMQLLAMLLEHPGEVVTREELQKKLWPADTFVDFDHGLNKAISKIREALSDSAESPRFVETVARRGYRFLAEVKVADTAPIHSPEPATQPHPSPEARERPDLAGKPAMPKHFLSSLAWKISVLVVLLLVASLAAWKLHSGNRPSLVIRSLAVLPLESLSSDASQDYFADGMTDELISDLGQISALRVISRTSVMSYKSVRKPLPEIAKELGVEAVVEGTVLRSGARVRIAAQLIEAPTDKRIWARSYEEDFRDMIGLQHRVARNIAEQVRATLSRREEAHLESGKRIDPTAYEAYLRGRFFWNKRTEDGLRKAISSFNQAIEADPTYAQPYAGLADSYALSGDWQHGMLPPKDAFPRARAAADQALALDDSLGEAHASLAFALDLYFWDWSAAEIEHKRAIALNPNYATAHQWYAWHLIVTGKNREALDELRKAASLDPLSLSIGADLADALCIAHLDQESVEQSRSILEMDPNFALGHYQLGQALTQRKMHDQAIAEFRTAMALAGDRPVFASNLAYALALSGRKDEAQHIVKELVAKQSQHSPSHSNIALAYVGLGDLGEAMVWLERAYQARFNPSILMRPAFDPLRYDPRFQELLRRLRLPSAG
jgi:TolB-like protein/DNA-binding winged helix-turn-helix (wHTH) protein/Flp pilus assembly protein TadD